MNTLPTVAPATRLQRVARFLSIVLSCVAIAPLLRAQLVEIHVEAHTTDQHTDPHVVDTVVWSFFSPEYQLSRVHVRIGDPTVSLTREHPGDWLYLWALPEWEFHVDDDRLGWNAEFLGPTDPWAPPRLTAYFGVEFEINPALSTALVNADISYELGERIAPVTPVPEPASAGLIASAVLAGAIAWRRRSLRRG